MKIAHQNSKYLKNINFSELKLWDVKRYVLNCNNNFKNAVLLGKILTPAVNKISKETVKNNNYRIISKINFGGKLFLRDFNDIFSYKGNLKLVKENSIIYSKINIKSGCIYYHNQNFEPFCVSSEYPTFTFNTDLVNGFFLNLILRSKKFKEILNAKSTGISKSRVKVDEFLDIQIPLPSLEEQNRLVKNYQDKIALAKEQEEQALELESKIDVFLLSELGIERIHNKDKKQILSFINFSESRNTWGADKLLRLNSRQILFSCKYKNVLLSDYVEINPQTSLTCLNDSHKITFIPMANINAEYGIVFKKQIGTKADTKGYTKFKDGDLIWARITPCMQNGKSAVLENLENGLGCGSTEFHVLRNKSKDLFTKYLHILLRMPLLLTDATVYFTGSSGQQRVPKSYLELLSIPLPPLEIQNKIVKKVSTLKTKIKSLKEKAKENRQLAINEFEKEIFTVED